MGHGSIAAVVAGLAVALAGFTRADPIAALVVVALMLRSAWRLLRDSGRVLLEAAPEGLDPEEIVPRHGLRARRARGPRSPRVGGHLRLPCAVGPRARGSGRRLPRPPARPRAAPRGSLLDRAHDPPGRHEGGELVELEPAEQRAAERDHRGCLATVPQPDVVARDLVGVAEGIVDAFVR